MRTRSRDDDDVIRARLRALLAEGQRDRGWVPEDDEPATDPWAGPDDDPDDNRDDDGDDDPDDEREQHPTREDGLPATLGRHRAPGRTTRLDPGHPAGWALWAVAVLAAAALVGWTWWDRPDVEQVPAAVTTVVPSGTAEPGSAIPSAAPTTPGPGGTVVVSVVGQVSAPGWSRSPPVRGWPTRWPRPAGCCRRPTRRR
ncbi:Arc/MetJ-type ribon-helix-helix transcriptional regulator [Modestobacter versicolor]|uniref:Arc/MetJ-type ribon-helix-helix transcriptional regulator n=1 Tax=Modestobacter versicolor TaxID=429133 RepID=A0A839XZF6_9ACTN|nr:hypothetical protein [Modestobacter versicolor]MBB3675919.1 Arc/MetJ-type ribon-helix-helix transcriptional regulator [Modestobacter versicolor]